MDSRHPVVRIIKLTYRSRVNGRVAVVYAKVPYSNLFDLTEKMTRMMYTNQVRWYRIEPASGQEIARVRNTLERWPDALARSCATTAIHLGA